MISRRTFIASSLAAPFVGTRAFAQDGIIKLRDLYDRQAISEFAQATQGQRISVDGYMAPPLKAETNFFVQTRRPMSVCPFCETEAEWPNDIVAVYAKRIINPVPYNVKIVTTGILELVAYRDPELGFVSLVRLMDATFA